MKLKHKILIVDDNSTNIKILQELLEDIYTLEVATTGEECMEKTLSFKPDLILLDIMLPGIDGYETCQKIKANPELENIKILMVSAKAMPHEERQGYEAGADEYITKPFYKDEIRAKIKDHLKDLPITESDQMQ